MGLGRSRQLQTAADPATLATFGRRGLDLWTSVREIGAWGEPLDLTSVNTEVDEGWPALSIDGQELWFTRSFSIWRSEKVDGEWGPTEQVETTLAGEPSLNSLGNLSFVHHFYKENQVIKANI